MAYKRVVHYSCWNACMSFVPACKLDWCYNHGLFEAPNTKDESKVTCERCLKQLSEWGAEESESFFEALEPKPDHDREMLSLLARLARSAR